MKVLCISKPPVLVSTRDLREALRTAEECSLPLRGRVVEAAPKLQSLGFHTGDPTTYSFNYFREVNFFEYVLKFQTLSRNSCMWWVSENYLIWILVLCTNTKLQLWKKQNAALFSRYDSLTSYSGFYFITFFKVPFIIWIQDTYVSWNITREICNFLWNSDLFQMCEICLFVLLSCFWSWVFLQKEFSIVKGPIERIPQKILPSGRLFLKLSKFSRSSKLFSSRSQNF